MSDNSFIDKLTAGELAAAERAAGMSVSTFDDPNFPTVPLLGALGWVMRRREEPGLKYDDYMNRHTLDEIQDHLGLDDEDEGKD